MKIKCIIVDDEPLSQDVLKKYIVDFPLLELAGTAADAFEANQMLLAGDIQLMFLDINMPKLSGIRFVKTLNNPPWIIFTTAYPEFAIEGFEIEAVDYLLKPFPFDRFVKSVNKVVEKVNHQQLKGHSGTGFILLKSDKKVYKINYNEISYLQSYGDYIKVFAAGKCLVIHDTFKNLLEQLPEDQFIRIHKSFVIALDKIKYMEGNQVKVDTELIPIGLNYKDDLFRTLKT